MSTHEPLRGLSLLSDEPIDGAMPDDLGRDSDARLLAELAIGTRGPFTIGVFGDWGTGKTSLLNRVQDLLLAPDARDPTGLQHPYVVPVFFNAWQYEREEEPIAHLASAIHDAVALRLNLASTWKTRASEKAIGWLRSVHDAARAGIYGTSLEPQAIPFLKLSSKETIDRYEKLQKEREDPDSKAWREHIGESVVMASLRSLRANDRLLDRVRPGEERRIPRVVVFLDDLDRCAAKDAFRILRKLKLALAQPGFVFVLSLNPGTLRKYVAEHSQEAGRDPEESAEKIYLDKLVQLIYPLKLAEEQFQAFTRALVEDRLSAYVTPEMHAIFKDLRFALRDSSDYNPRTLKRRINALIIDARLAPKQMLDRINADEASARAQFLGLCLLEQTARHLGRPALLDRLGSNQWLCEEIARAGVGPLFKERQRVKSGDGKRSDADVDGRQASALIAHDSLLEELWSLPAVASLLRHDFAVRWLKDPDLRGSFARFLSLRPDHLNAVSHAEIQLTQERKNAQAITTEQATGVMPSTEREGERKADKPATISEQERAIVERAVRKALNLNENEDLSPEHWAEVNELDLSHETISDDAIGWLARTDTGLKALTTLKLWRTPVTNAGVEALSRADTGLNALKTLDIGGTQVTDAGMEALSRANTGLRKLTKLDLDTIQLTDVGVQILSRADTGLKSLRTLLIWGTPVTDTGVEALCRTDTGLNKLIKLDLDDTQVTDAGVAILSRANTGLGALTDLNLGRTKITDAGLEVLSRVDTGLKALETLDIEGTQVTDAGMEALSRADTGLEALKTLEIGGTQVTDAGVKTLSRANTGLKTLTTLGVGRTRVTDVGVKALSRSDTGLKALTMLNVENTQITDVAAEALSRADTGLKALESLDVGRTQITDVAVAALSSADTGLKALTKLQLNNTQVTDAAMKVLSRADTGLKALTMLNVDNTQVTEAGRKRVVKRFPRIYLY